MPDSLPPPSWGPAPFDERDLDAVLSGETADIPVALRPVADTLAALRAAAAPAELSGQATIMAEFRALGPGEAARPADPATTLRLPADRPRRRAARHRGRRRAALRMSLRAGTLTGLAAAAVIVAAVVFTGNLPGPIQRLAHLSTVSPHPAPELQVRGATAEPTNSPAHSRLATASSLSSEPSRLCRAYYEYLKHPGPASWRAEAPLLEELSQLAGGLNHMSGYCNQHAGDLPGTGPHDRGTSPGSGQDNPAQPGPDGNAGPAPGNGGSGAGQGNQGGSGARS